MDCDTIICVLIVILIVFLILCMQNQTMQGFAMFDPDVQEPYIDMKFKQNLPTYDVKVSQSKYFANSDWYPTKVD